jgi:hypothetical protein
VIEGLKSFWIKSESMTLFSALCRLLGVCSVIKIMSLFPIYKLATLTDCLFATIGLIASIAMIFQIRAQGAAFFLFCIFSLAWHGLLFEYQNAIFYTHHVQLLIIMLIGFCLFSPAKNCNENFSLSGVIQGSGFQLIRLTIVIIYLSGIIMKFDPTFLNGHQMKLIFMEHYWGSDWLEPEWNILFRIASWSALFTEILILSLLLSIKTRIAAVCVGWCFHFCLFLILPVSIFSFLMMGALILFIPQGTFLLGHNEKQPIPFPLETD